MPQSPRPEVIEIFVFRHGETDWNRERRFQGHTDIPLNEEGRLQAQKLRALLEGLDPQVFISSDLRRARATAEIVNAGLARPLILSESLRECRLGEPEGWERERLHEVYGPQAWERWLSILPEDQAFAFPGGESKREHLQRLRDFVEDFVRRHPQWTRVAISTHGGSLLRLVHACTGAPTERVAMPNCVLYHLSFAPARGEWKYHGRLESATEKY